MPDKLNFEKIDAMAAVYAVNATLRRIDERLIDHGERVAFIAGELAEAGNLELNRKALFLLSIFHDIGAYKTEEIDRMVEFETHDVQNHSVYGYLFIKYMTPLRDYADAILYHHSSWKELKDKTGIHKELAAMLHLADRIDIATGMSGGVEMLEKLNEKSGDVFNPEYLEIARRFYSQRHIAERIADKSYREENTERCRNFLPSADETLEYLKMIVYSIDFRSEHTVTHTVNTVSLALNIARHFGLGEEELEKIYLGALLHDVGKIAIPVSILEYPGKLSDSQMVIMRTHVDETEELIGGIVPEDICRIAIRHHEKLDGSGYPHQLKGDVLTLPERIVAVADIVSALSSRRSYKEPFPRDKTISILGSMSSSQLDPEICRYVMDNYDNIMKITDPPRAEVINRYQNIMSEFERISTELGA